MASAFSLTRSNSVGASIQTAIMQALPSDAPCCRAESREEKGEGVQKRQQQGKRHPSSLFPASFASARLPLPSARCSLIVSTLAQPASPAADARTPANTAVALTISSYQPFTDIRPKLDFVMGNNH